MPEQIMKCCQLRAYLSQPDITPNEMDTQEFYEWNNVWQEFYDTPHCEDCTNWLLWGLRGPVTDDIPF